MQRRAKNEGKEGRRNQWWWFLDDPVGLNQGRWMAVPWTTMGTLSRGRCGGGGGMISNQKILNRHVGGGIEDKKSIL